MPTIQELQQAQQKQMLAQSLLASSTQKNTPLEALAAGLGGLLASRKTGNRVNELQTQIETGDKEALARLMSGDPSGIAQIQNPEYQKIAYALFGRMQDSAERQSTIDRQDQIRSEDLARSDRLRAEDQRLQQQRFEQEQAAKQAEREDRQSFQLQLEQMRQDATAAKERSTPDYTQKQTIQANRKRYESLAEGKAGRDAAISRAEDFLAVFEGKGAQGHLADLDFSEGEKASSGKKRELLSWLPTFTDQGRFDELFNSFAEDAARARLKANGETRPTDADVEGQKRAMFGVGKDRKANVALLRTFIEEQRALEEEFTSVSESLGVGSKVMKFEDGTTVEFLE